MNTDIEYVYKISNFIRKTYNITYAESEFDVDDNSHELYVTDDSDEFNAPHACIINMFTNTCCKIGLQS